jgi:hypothetical protein
MNHKNHTHIQTQTYMHAWDLHAFYIHTTDPGVRITNMMWNKSRKKIHARKKATRNIKVSHKIKVSKKY